jgi:hypothetical protein
MTTLSEPPWLPRYPGTSTGIPPQLFDGHDGRNIDPSPRRINATG